MSPFFGDVGDENAEIDQPHQPKKKAAANIFIRRLFHARGVVAVKRSLDLHCTICHSTHVIPFRVEFRSGASLFEQVVYASKKAMIAGQLKPGDPYPSVRALSRELKINPNTAHKIVAHLVSEGLLETRPGIGTVVAELPDSTREERTQLLGREMETLVVEAKRLGIGLEEMIDSFTAHWKRLKPLQALNQDGGKKK